MAELAVTAIGADRPGIIARVTKVLFEHGGNLEDSSMTILRGHFAIMLLVSCDTEPASLEAALAEATADLDLTVTVRPVGPGVDSSPPTHVLTVYEADRPGLVHDVASSLAGLDVNVTDLETRLLSGEQAVYAMVFEVSLPEALAPARVVETIRAAAEGAEVNLSPLEVGTF
jgi:glycine cleavage system transcriptional repressor